MTSGACSLDSAAGKTYSNILLDVVTLFIYKTGDFRMKSIIDRRCKYCCSFFGETDRFEGGYDTWAISCYITRKLRSKQ